MNQKNFFFVKHNIEMHVFPVGVTKAGNIGAVNSATDVAWFKHFATPGEEGNAIFTGHITWKKAPGHFAKLLEMELYDEVFVQFADESIKYFYIAELYTVPYDDTSPELISNTGSARVTLITCKGDYDRTIGTSQTRVIAICLEKDAPFQTFSAPPLLPPKTTPKLQK